MVRVTSALFPMDSTLCIIKPDAMRLGYKQNICHMIHMFGFNVIAEGTFKVITFDPSLDRIRSLRAGFKSFLTIPIVGISKYLWIAIANFCRCIRGTAIFNDLLFGHVYVLVSSRRLETAFSYFKL